MLNRHANKITFCVYVNIYIFADLLKQYNLPVPISSFFYFFIMPMHFSPNIALFGATGRFRDSLGAFYAIFPTDLNIDFEKWTLLAT